VRERPLPTDLPAIARSKTTDATPEVDEVEDSKDAIDAVTTADAEDAEVVLLAFADFIGALRRHSVVEHY
jgi:hypothetical protein